MESWLKSIGLAHRSAAFRSHDVDPARLAELGEKDLRDLGLTIGERKRFRQAVQTLPNRPCPLPHAIADRRWLSVMTVDLVQSSVLGERLEAEDLLEVICCYREFCGRIVARFGGHVAQLVGDGILACFCYPVANDDDAERAVGAALEIAAGLGALDTPAGAPLSARLGVATGEVIVTDLSTGTDGELGAIFGITPTLASRLQGLAAPNGVLINQATYEQVAEHFVCEDRGLFELCGLAQAHRVWSVSAPRAAPTGRPAGTPEQPP
jgi:class 3 adenylate cyclase